MSVATHELRVDLDNDELFTSGESVASAVDGPAGATLLKFTRGRSAARLLAQPAAGTFEFAVKNQDGTYDPGSNLTAGRRVRYRATFGGVTYAMFMGRLDLPEQIVGGDFQHYVKCTGYGSLATLVGKKISTALYESTATGALIAAVLDAAAYPKNAGGYLLDLTPSGYWPLGEASGNALDLSGNGNNGTVTIGAGVRDAAALDDAGDGAIDFDGAATKIIITAAAVIDNVWDGGGSVAFLWKPGSTGAPQILVGKRTGGGSGWYFMQDGLGLLTLHHDFSTTAGTWYLPTALTVGTPYLVVLTYNADAVANDPTLYLVNLTTGVLTTPVLTEFSTPVGTRLSDAAADLGIGHLNSASYADGMLDEVALFTTALTAAQVKAWAARCLNAPRHLDAGQTVPSFWWADKADALQAIVKIVNSEGPGAALYDDGSGAIVFKNRHAILTEARSTVDQYTFRTAEGGAEPLCGFRYEHGLRDKILTASATVKVRTAKSLGVAWSLGGTLNLAAGETRQVVARTSTGDPMKAAVTPVVTTDYTVASGSVSSVSLDRTSGAEIIISITAGTSATSITGLQLRAQQVSVDSVTTVRDQHGNTGDDLPSYTLPILEEVDVDDAQAFVDSVVGSYEDGRPRGTLVVEGIEGDTRMEAALSLDVHDRVRVIDSATNTDKDYYVHQITIELIAPNRLRATFAIEEALAEDFGIWDAGLWDSARWAA